MNGETIRGLEFRMALGLRSTNLSWSIKGQNAVFQVKGYGHGVGMCQYGADGMARQGRTFKEILAYYYRGRRLQGSSRSSVKGFRIEVRTPDTTAQYANQRARVPHL